MSSAFWVTFTNANIEGRRTRKALFRFQ